MATIQQIRRAAESHGGSLECDDNGNQTGFVSYSVVAPDRKLWGCTFVHVLSLEWRKGDSKYRDAALTDAAERLTHGVADCTDPDCDVCNDY